MDTINNETRRPKQSYVGFIILGFFFILLSFGAGVGGAFVGVTYLFAGQEAEQQVTTPRGDIVSVTSEESAVIDVAKSASPSVVSIIISKDLPVYEQYYEDSPYFSIPRRRQVGSEERQIGAGSGFVVDKTGLILTNRHVVSDTSANYTAVLSDGTKLAAKILARDTVLDIALIKVETDQDLVPLNLGDSDKILVGQITVAIGNSLGQFSNTVSTGIVSGLSRSIQTGQIGANDNVELLSGVIQTDASINPGNSGGPLLNLRGEVVGVNVAIAQNAENIGFAIPINAVKPVIDSVKEFGEIRRPYLGVRYVQLDANIAKELNLKVSEGAYLRDNNGQPAIIANGPAAKAGLKAGDVVTHIGSQKLDGTHSLQTEVQRYKVGETVQVTYLRSDTEAKVNVVLEKAVE